MCAPVACWASCTRQSVETRTRRGAGVLAAWPPSLPATHSFHSLFSAQGSPREAGWVRKMEEVMDRRRPAKRGPACHTHKNRPRFTFIAQQHQRGLHVAFQRVRMLVQRLKEMVPGRHVHILRHTAGRKRLVLVRERFRRHQSRCPTMSDVKSMTTCCVLWFTNACVTPASLPLMDQQRCSFGVTATHTTHSTQKNEKKTSRFLSRLVAER